MQPPHLNKPKEAGSLGNKHLNSHPFKQDETRENHIKERVLYWILPYRAQTLTIKRETRARKLHVWNKSQTATNKRWAPKLPWALRFVHGGIIYSTCKKPCYSL